MNLQAEQRRARIARKIGAHIRIDAGIRRKDLKLTFEEVQDVLWKYEQGLTPIEISKIYGVHRNYIHNLRCRLKKTTFNKPKIN